MRRQSLLFHALIIYLPLLAIVSSLLSLVLPSDSALLQFNLIRVEEDVREGQLHLLELPALETVHHINRRSLLT